MDPAGPAALCIELYARLAKRNEASHFGAGRGGNGIWEDGEAAKIEPT
jgi:hypothetical protein